MRYPEVIKQRLFGTDGIRGKANRELTPELAVRVGYCAVKVLAHDNARPYLLVGRDTRISGTMLESALAAGICAAGGTAELLGVVPTPAVAHLTRKKSADAGVVISASHNPAEDNGIKFFHYDGYKLPDEMEREIESLIRGGGEEKRPLGDKVGRACTSEDAEEEYMKFLLSTSRPDLSSMRVVVDCANGAVYRLAPMLLRNCGAEVIAIHSDPDGVNINRECGSTHPEDLQRGVTEKGADLGLAYDGDADRVLAVDEKGRLVDGDFIMAICALQMKRDKVLNDNALVTTVMTNLGFHQAMCREGVDVHLTQVGDRYVLESMLEKGLNLGGEQSGHIIFLDYATTGDGLITSIKLLEAMQCSGEPLSSLASVMKRIPQLLINVSVKDKEALGDSEIITRALAEWERRLEGKGRILLRPSGTEPVVRVMVEDVNEGRAETAARELATLIEREMS
ncbi:MAG: phosphoglucosamine mutase [Actinomycetota bacterium]|nr:phosphoglucosamine mutase [Actinomycetota bacterium]